jgi:hypothetical protein
VSKEIVSGSSGVEVLAPGQTRDDGTVQISSGELPSHIIGDDLTNGKA